MTEATVSRCCELLVSLLDSEARTEADVLAGKLRDFLECFVSLSTSEQEEIRSVLMTPEARRIASLSVLAAEQALLSQDDEWLTWSLVAQDVEQFRDDPRNNLRLLAVTHYAVERIGADARHLFDRVSSVVSPRTASFIRDFASRPQALRTLESMGVHNAADGDRVRFVFD
jgi:hypothetical protein